MKRNNSFNSIRNYEVDTKNRSLRKEKKELNYNYNFNKKIYKILFSFGIVIMFFLLSPMIFGKHYDYKTVKQNEVNVLSNEISYQIENVVYSENDSLLRTDIQLINTSTFPVLSNIKLREETKTIANPNKKIKNQLVKISEDYYVLYSHINPKFEVAKVIVNIDKQSGSSISDKGISAIEFYVNKKKVKGIDKLKVDNYISLFIETKEQQIKEIKNEIKSINSELNDQKEAKIAYEKSINSLKDEKKYAVGEEVNTIDDKIKSNELSIDTANEKTQELKDKVSSLEKKITVLQTYIDDMNK